MPTFYTHRNYVSVGRALPGDRHVATYITAQGGRTLLTTQPIEQMASAVRWAMEMADYMAGPLEVLAFKSEDDLFREIITAVGFEGLWRTDPADQRAGRDLLIKLGVLKE